METAKEKAKEIVDSLPFAVACHRAHLERAIVYALREQDRDTRHACAGAVIMLPDFNKYTDSDGNQWVGLNAAHDACMRVKVN